MSHLLEKRAYRLNQLNHKLSKENYILSQKLNESRQPNFRYFISPYLGFKLSKDDSVYSGGKEFGLCFGSRVGKQVNLQAGLGYLTYHSVQGSASEIQQNVRYQLGGTYDLNPGEFARVFLSTGIDGNFGSSNFDMIGYGGLGLTLDTSDHFSTRMGIRYGNDILLNCWIQYPQAIFGTAIEVPTLSGKVKLKIPSGIKSGQVLRLKAKGMPELNRNHYGDQLVKINIETPKKYSKKAKSLLEDLSEELQGVVNFEKFQ